MAKPEQKKPPVKQPAKPGSLDKGEALPPAGMGPIASGLFAAFFMLVPAALAVLLEPVVKPEVKLNGLLGGVLADPLAAPIFAALFHLFVLQWLAMCVNGARIKYSVAWPTLYVDKAHPHATAYNCAQRAHQHVLEQTPTLLVLLVIASFDFPLTAGVGGCLFSFSKIVGNVFGYSSGNAKKKDRGAFGYLGLLTLIGLSVLVGLRKAGHAAVFTANVESAYERASTTIGPYASAAVDTVTPFATKALKTIQPHIDTAMAAIKGASE